MHRRENHIEEKEIYVFILSVVFGVNNYELFIEVGVILMFFVDGRLGLRREREV